jgi:hypothetical protein
MKLWKVWSVFGVGTAAMAAMMSYQAGCSGGGDNNDAGPIGQPPPPPDGGTAPSTTVETFAVNKLLLGEASRAGAPSNTAWKDYGYNLDGLVTDKSSTNVCTLAAGAPKTNQVDGTNGIDNAWGAVMLPLIQSATSMPTPSQVETAYIDQGNWTLQLQVTGLSDDPSQTALGLTSQVFMSGVYGNSIPTFDSTTDWPVLSTSVKDGQTIASGSVVQFKGSYVSGGTFVSGPGPNPVVLPLDLQGIQFPLAIHNAVFTFDHVDHADAANGTIAGVLDTQEFIAALQKVAGFISPSLCGSAFAGIAQQIMQASDILTDGTNVANTACTAISVGIGFTARLVANPTQVVPAPSPAPDPCGG